MTASHVVGGLSQAHGETDEVFVADAGAGSAGDRMVGRVVRSEPPAFTDQVGVDAALVEPREEVELGAVVRIEDPSRLMRDITREPMSGEIIVHKRGYNGFTSGLLERRPTILLVHMRGPNGDFQEVTYYDGYWIHSTDSQPFARSGDSGAIVVDDDDCVVGMLVAVEGEGRSAEDRAFCVPISSIVESLNVELVGPRRQCSL